MGGSSGTSSADSGNGGLLGVVTSAAGVVTSAAQVGVDIGATSALLGVNVGPTSAPLLSVGVAQSSGDLLGIGVGATSDPLLSVGIATTGVRLDYIVPLRPGKL